MRFCALALVMASLPLAGDAGIPPPSVFEGYPTPAPILRGLIMTESGGRASAIGDDGLSRGAGQLNRKFDKERAFWWGRFDPLNIHDSIRITSRLFEANMKALLMTENIIDPSTWEEKRVRIAIGAHRQGLWGALRDGPTEWYVKRVMKYGGME